MNRFELKLIKSLMAVTTALISASALADDMGTLSVTGKAGAGQPTKVFVEGCRTDGAGQLVKFSCGDDLIKLYNLDLNSSIALPAGLYLVVYEDIGLGNIVEVSPQSEAVIHLEQVDIPQGIPASEVRVAADLTSPDGLSAYLLTSFALDSFEQYQYEQNSSDTPPPDTPANQQFFQRMEQASKPGDLLNVLLHVDANGTPAFWNPYSGSFVDALQTISPGENGGFVAVLPGAVFMIQDYSGGGETPTKVTYGVRSRLQ